MMPVDSSISVESPLAITPSFRALCGTSAHEKSRLLLVGAFGCFTQSLPMKKVAGIFHAFAIISHQSLPATKSSLSSVSRLTPKASRASLNIALI
jgi:hypothetical protein